MGDKSIWEQNFKVLEKKRPELLHRLNRLLENDKTQVGILKAESGDVTAIVKRNTDSREVLLHSLKDPWAEADNIAEGISISNGEFRCLMGMGLGYLPIKLFKRELPLTVFLIIVASPRIFEAALKNMDLTQLLVSDRVIFLLGDEKIFDQLFQLHEIAIVSHGLSVTTYEPERELFSDFYKDMNLSIVEHANSLLSSVSSLKGLGKYTFENIMSNCTTIFKSVNIDVLKDCAKGLPAVIIGAGPSLADSLPVLKRLSHRAFLVAVDSALPILMDYDIDPHLVVSVDYSVECFEKIRSIIDKTDKIPLCYPSAVNFLVAKLYRCPIKFFISTSSGFLHKLWSPLNSWANLPPMQGVAHLAFFIAAISSASPIILTGFDLAYTNFSSHSAGMKVPVTINLDTAPWIQGIDGHMLPTMKQMLGIRATLELLIKSCGIPCFNANKRGACIEGAPLCDLEKVLLSDEYAEKDLAAVIKKRFEMAKRPELTTIISMLKDFIKNTEKLEAEIKKVFLLFDKALKSVENDPMINNHMSSGTVGAFNNALKAYDDMNKAITNAYVDEMFHLINGQLMDLEIESRRLRSKFHEMAPKEKFILDISLSKRFMEIKENGLKEIKYQFTKLFRRLSDEKQLLKKLNNSKSPVEKMRLFRELGSNYIEYEDALQAEDVLREALKIAKDDADSMILLSKALIMQFRYKEATDWIEKVCFLAKDKLQIQTFKENGKLWIEKKLTAARFHINTVVTYINLPLAVIYCKDVLECYPDHEEAKTLLDEAESKINAYEYKTSQLIEFIKEDEIVAVDRIDELFEGNREAFADQVLTILLKKYPDSTLAREKLALLKIKTGDKSTAKDLLIQAVSLSPSRPDARIHLGALYAEEGDYKEAKSYILEALKLDANGLVFLNEALGDLNFELGCYEEAILNYEKFFLAYPDKKYILKRMGDCYHQLGQYSAAQAAWKYLTDT